MTVLAYNVNVYAALHPRPAGVFVLQGAERGVALPFLRATGCSSHIWQTTLALAMISPHFATWLQVQPAGPQGLMAGGAPELPSAAGGAPAFINSAEDMQLFAFKVCVRAQTALIAPKHGWMCSNNEQDPTWGAESLEQGKGLFQTGAKVSQRASRLLSPSTPHIMYSTSPHF